MENILFSCLLQVVALEDLALFFICVHEKKSLYGKFWHFHIFVFKF